MNVRLIAIAAIAAVADIQPSNSRASSDVAALTACAKVFAAGLSTRAAPATGYRITFANRGYVETVAQYESGIYTYDVVARDAKSGAALASATCTVDETGAVMALSYVPLTAAAPALAAR